MVVALVGVSDLHVSMTANSTAQKQYDMGRRMWLARQRIKTVRFWNAAVLEASAEERIKQMLGFKTS